MTTLPEAARQWRDEMLRRFHIEGPAELAVLDAAAVQFARMTAAQEAIDRDGAFVRDRFGFVREHPGCVTERAAAALLLKLVTAIDLDPRDLDPEG